MRFLLLPLSLLCISGCWLDSDMNAGKVEGHDFTYLDIEKHCKAKRYSDTGLSLACGEAKLKPISRSCEGYITGGLKDTHLTCGGDLWMVPQRCTIAMRAAQWGEINCVL